MNSAKYRNTNTDEKMNMLTPRETEILRMVVEGMNNRQIADQLFISVRTVETHKTAILKKLDLSSTVEPVKFALKNKIIEL